MIEAEQLFQEALRRHHAGEVAQAGAMYRQVLAANPNHADALQNLGAIACQAGAYPAAIELISRAIAINPKAASYYSNLGEVLNRAGRRGEAVAVLRQARALDPANMNAFNNLFLVLATEKRLDEALTLCHEALRMRPNHPLIVKCMGDALLALRRPAEALAAYEAALRADPNYADARFNLATVLYEQGRLDEATAHYRECLRLTPHDAETHYRMGEIAAGRGVFTEARGFFEAALRLNPKHGLAAAGIASALKNSNQVDEAIAAYETALMIDPSNAVALANLGNTLRDAARVDEAIGLFQKAVAMAPENAAIRSGLILTYYLHPEHCVRSAEEEKARWNRAHALPLAGKMRPHTNDADPERRLRIGYVSADFRSHPVARFMLPILGQHDRGAFEVYCYHNHFATDDVTERLRAMPRAFRSVVHLPDDTLAQVIRDDRIDLLIDLNMHTIGNRLTMFAQKPAPVQMCYLAYTDGTGLSAMDYRLTDPYLDAPGAAADPPFEKPLRLAETYWCYIATGSGRPLFEPAAESPARTAGYVTFGSLNYFSKVTPQALAVWGRLLREVAGARLLLHVPEGECQARVRRTFEGMGIAADRLLLTPRLIPQDYYRLYHRIDIALDTFPYAGGTTTCDALHMGVPVVTLAGESPTGRGGVSILSNLGLRDLIAGTPEEYVRIAAGLAGDLPRLAELRKTLRPRLEQSPLMNIPRFVANLEAAYRSAWRKWCEGARSQLP